MSKTQTIPRRNYPIATLGIIAANILVAICVCGDLQTAIADYGLVPSSMTAGQLVTACFLHDGYAHLAVNMVLLYAFGRGVERAMGWMEFSLFYIGACFAASLSHVAIVYASLPPHYATQPIIGASGAIAGVMGAYAVRYHRRVYSMPGIALPALFLIMIWLGLQLALGILGLYRDEFIGFDLRGVGYWSHLGGFGYGIGIALIANMALQGEREYLLRESRRRKADGSLLEAIQSCETLLKFDPANMEAHGEMGRLWAMLEERELSIPCFHRAIDIAIATGREEEAFEEIAELRRCWPDIIPDPTIRLKLATYLEETGNIERAAQVFTQLADESPNSPEAQASLIKLAALRLHTQNDRAAAEVIETLISKYPDGEWNECAKRLG